MRSLFFACLVLSLNSPLLLSQSKAAETSTPRAATDLPANATHSLLWLLEQSSQSKALPGRVPWIPANPTVSSTEGIEVRALLSNAALRPAASIFLTASTFLSGGEDASAMAVGDVNRDGVPDLVVANECGSVGCGEVEVFLGNGDGTFRSGPSFATGGSGPTSVAIADVNRDGKPDVVVTNQYSNDAPTGAVSILLGNGDGTFQPAVSYSSGGTGTSSVAVGDLNGDGRLDLAVANECINPECATGAVAVFFGSGNGTFTLSAVYGSGGEDASSIALGDVNGDGKPDIAVATGCASLECSAEMPPVGTVSVLLNAGNGTLKPAVSYNTASQDESDSVALADINGDGRLDLVVGNECLTEACTTGSVSVLLGKGNGSFGPAATYSSGGTGNVAVTVMKPERGGSPNVIAVNECNNDANCLNGTVGVLAAKANGTLASVVSYGSAAFLTNSIAVADVNLDGRPDLVVTSACSDGGCATGAVSVLLGGLSGTFVAAPNYQTGGANVTAIATADLRRDGNSDLVTVSECASGPACGAVNVQLGDGHGDFGKAVTYGSGGVDPHSVAIGDVNGDGIPDLVVANVLAGSGATAGSIGVLLGKGDGTFRPVMTLNSGAVNTVSVKIADVNGDGKPDLVAASQYSSTDYNDADGAVSVLLGNGKGGFATAVIYDSGGKVADSVAVADVNRDGKPDLVVSNWCMSPTDCTSGNAGVLLGNGNGTFEPAVAYETGGQYSSPVAIADLNGDGKLDLVVANEDSIGVLLGNGDGTFEAASVTATPPEADSGDGSLAIADFNGDGRLDVASGAAGVLLLGNGDGTLEPAVPLGAAGSGLAAGNFDHSGRISLADTGVTVLRNLF